jgi:putative flippase GtrA
MSHSISGQSVRYLLVGAVVYGVDLGLFTVIIALSSARLYVAANVAAKVAGAAVGFALHKNVTFTWQQQSSIVVQSLLYGTLLLFNMGLSTALLYLAVSGFAQSAIASKIAIDIVVVGISFVISRSLVFRPEPRQG